MEEKHSSVSRIKNQTFGLAIPILWLFSAISISNGIHARHGFYSPAAIYWIGFGLLLGCISTMMAPQAGRGILASLALKFILPAAVIWNYYQLAFSGLLLAEFPPDITPQMQSVILGGLSTAIVMTLIGFLIQEIAPQWNKLRLLSIVVPVFVTGVAVIYAASSPNIDVWILQQDGSRALMQGHNPYGINIPDIYPAGLYPPEVQHDGRIWIGYCYLPGSLLLALPAVALFNDCRYAHLAAILISAVLMATARPSRLSYAVATVFLFMPRLYFVLGQSWTDIFVLLAFSVLMFCSCRVRSKMPLAFAFLLVTKQYVIFFLPVIWLLKSRLAVRQMVQAFCMAAVVIVPFVLWDFEAFWRNCIAIDRWFAIRSTSLSVPNWLHKQGILMPGWITFVCIIAMSLWIRRQWKPFADNEELAPSLFAGASGLVFLVFFFFAKEAFCNYYFFVVSLFFWAVALWPIHNEAGEIESHATQSPA